MAGEGLPGEDREGEAGGGQTPGDRGCQPRTGADGFGSSECRSSRRGWSGKGAGSSCGILVPLTAAAATTVRAPASAWPVERALSSRSADRQVPWFLARVPPAGRWGVTLAPGDPYPWRLPGPAQPQCGLRGTPGPAGRTLRSPTGCQQVTRLSLRSGLRSSGRPDRGAWE